MSVEWLELGGWDRRGGESSPSASTCSQGWGLRTTPEAHPWPARERKPGLHQGQSPERVPGTHPPEKIFST